VRHFVDTSNGDTNSATTVNCKGDWVNLKVGRDASDRLFSSFRCKCPGGSATIKAVLVGGSWLLYSNCGGFHTAVEVVPGRLAPLSSHHKMVSNDIMLENPTAGRGTVLKHFHERHRADISHSHLGVNRGKFDKQVQNHVR
jgi:hypothetical protein